jgi:hypothetical protein
VPCSHCGLETIRPTSTGGNSFGSPAVSLA